MVEKINFTILQTIGKNIKRIRLLNGLSQESLASDINKSVNFVSLLENGKTGLSITTIVDLCRALDVDSNAIFAGTIPKSTADADTFIMNSLNLFNNDDKKMVTDLITYIANSKT